MYAINIKLNKEYETEEVIFMSIAEKVSFLKRHIFIKQNFYLKFNSYHQNKMFVK